MKKLLFLSAIAVMAVSCSVSTEKKLSSLVARSVSETLAFPDSYMPVETTVDSAFAPICDPEFIQNLLEYNEKLGSLGELKDDVLDLMAGSSSVESVGEAVRRFEEVKAEVSSMVKDLAVSRSAAPKFIGYLARHKYSFNDESGEKVTGEKYLLLKKGFSSVLESWDGGEYARICEVLDRYDKTGGFSDELNEVEVFGKTCDAMRKISEDFTKEFLNVITYSTNDGKPLNLRYPDRFGANIILNVYADNQGLMLFDGPVTIIGEESFWIRENLVRIALPIGVKEIGERAFWNCFQLTSITLPEGLETIGPRAFWNCFALNDAVIPESVETIEEGAFWNCRNLSVTVPSSVKKIGNNAFLNCKKN